MKDCQVQQELICTVLVRFRFGHNRHQTGHEEAGSGDVKVSDRNTSHDTQATCRTWRIPLGLRPLANNLCDTLNEIRHVLSAGWPCHSSWPLREYDISVVTHPHTPITAHPHTPITAHPHTPITAHPHTPITAHPHTPITAHPHTPITAHH